MILSLETSGNVCSAALHDRGQLVAAIEFHERQAHAAKLAVLIEQLLSSSEAGGKKLTAVAVSAGPGSYTGLRIGTSTAKGICYSLSIPLLAVGSLELLAFQASKELHDTWLCPMIDARRMEVYAMLLDSKGKVIHDVEARIIDEDSYKDYLHENRVTFFGDGASKCQQVIRHPNACFTDKVYLTAKGLGEIAYKKYLQSEFEDLFHFEPYYLKEFIAKKPTRSLL